jgi:hypothetical protein
MKPETKLRLRKWALMALRSIVWHVDEWLHAQEVKYRDEISLPVRVAPAGPARPQGATVSCAYPFPEDELMRHRIRGRIPRDRQPKRNSQTPRRRGMTAAEFDLRFAR